MDHGLERRAPRAEKGNTSGPAGSAKNQGMVSQCRRVLQTQKCTDSPFQWAKQLPSAAAAQALQSVCLWGFNHRSFTKTCSAKQFLSSLLINKKRH